MGNRTRNTGVDCGEEEPDIIAGKRPSGAMLGQGTKSANSKPNLSHAEAYAYWVYIQAC